MQRFLGVTNAPVLTSNSKEEYVACVDQIVNAFLPDRNENPEFHNLVKLYQLHRHSRTCRKYQNEHCRFKFGKFFAKETLVAEPSPENNAIKEYVKEDILHAKNEILDKVKDYIKTILNPSK